MLSQLGCCFSEMVHIIRWSCFQSAGFKENNFWQLQICKPLKYVLILYSRFLKSDDAQPHNIFQSADIYVSKRCI